MKYKKKNSGQVLILGVFFTCISLLLLLMLFNTGQHEYERQKATNIADAAVYSGLQFQARSLNYIAYTNRAMVANHVAIGQMVSTFSWLEYVEESLHALSTLVQFIPVVGSALAMGLEAFSTGADLLARTIPPAIASTQVVIKGLAGSQAVIYATTHLETSDMIEYIIHANDPRYELTTNGQALLLLNIHKWHNFTDNHNDDRKQEANARFADVVQRSGDQWLNNRSNSIDLLTVPHPTRLGYINFQFFKRGSTQLVQLRDGEWHWEARDAASFIMDETWWSVSWRGTRRRERRTELVPFPTSNSATTHRELLRGTWYNDIPLADRFSRYNQNVINSNYEFSTDYRDLTNFNPDNENDESIELALEVGISRSAIRSSETMHGIGANNSTSVFNLEPQSEESVIRAISKGIIFFERPVARTDNGLEHANLFNPYWIVRLTDDSQEKALSWLSNLLVRPDLNLSGNEN